MAPRSSKVKPKLYLLQIDRRGLALLTAFKLEAQPLPLMEIADPRALDRRNMNEHVL